MVQMVEEQQKQFGDLLVYNEKNENLHPDENGLVRIAQHERLPVLVPTSMNKTVLRHVHGSALPGYYRMHSTVDRIKGKFWR